MCTVSNIGTEWNRTSPWTQPNTIITLFSDGPTRAEFDELKREILALKELLIAAKKFDAATNQPEMTCRDCGRTFGGRNVSKNARCSRCRSLRRGKIEPKPLTLKRLADRFRPRPKQNA